ncbi:MAG: hypothetical protein HFH14_01930, partial [Lachnospiraceae bacterium]|nr:hypothetical protein [Lachnospiraceae bacterium]
MRKRKILIMLLCIMSILCGLSGTYSDAAAKNKSSYTRKELNVRGKDKYGDYINMAQHIDLSYNKKYKLCTLYAHEDREEVVTCYVRSWPAKGKVTDWIQKKRNKEHDIADGMTKIDDDGTIVSMDTSWMNYYDERKRRVCIKFNAVNAKGELISHFQISKFDTDMVGHFFDPRPVGKHGRQEGYRLEDFEIDGDYVDYIVARSPYYSGVNYASFVKDSAEYSLQRVNWKTGEIVSFHELPRPCQKLCGGFPYGTDMNSF